MTRATRSKPALVAVLVYGGFLLAATGLGAFVGAFVSWPSQESGTEPMSQRLIVVVAGALFGLLTTAIYLWASLVDLKRAKRFIGQFPLGSVWFARGITRPFVLSPLAIAIVTSATGIDVYNYFSGRQISVVPWDRIGRIDTRATVIGGLPGPPFRLTIEVDGVFVEYRIYGQSAARGVGYLDDHDLRKVIASLESHRPKVTE